MKKNRRKKTCVEFATASELYDKVLNIYTTQYDKLTKAQKKRIKVRNRPENLVLDLYLDEDEDDLPQMLLQENEEVKSEPEENTAKRVNLREKKLNPRKRKNEGIGLKNLDSKRIVN